MHPASRKGEAYYIFWVLLDQSVDKVVVRGPGPKPTGN